MLGKDTLSLFVDDGLQVGRYRWIKVDKVEGMRRYGDIQAALEEDKAACLKEGLGPTFPDDAPPSHAQARTRAARSPNHVDPICPGDGDDQQKWSPEDHRDVDGDDAEEAGPMMHISPGVDLLIKMHDLFLAIKRFNLRLSARNCTHTEIALTPNLRERGQSGTVTRPSTIQCLHVEHCGQTTNCTLCVFVVDTK